jgi:non-ribosomal peptide synthetase component F
VAGRNEPVLEGIIGLFANTVVLRTDVAAEAPFADVLRRVRRTAVEAYEHQDAPFSKVVERLKPPRGLGAHPLVQVAFDFAEGADGPRRFGSATATNIGGYTGDGYRPAEAPVAARLDLELFLAEAADGSLQATLVYAADLFDPATMANVAGEYCDLLEGIAAG